MKIQSDNFLVTGRIYSPDTGSSSFAWMEVNKGKVVRLASGAAPSGICRLDFGNSVVLPAFIDAHVHLLECGLNTVFPDLTDANSLDAVFEKLSSARGIAQQFGFLLAYNLEPVSFNEQRMPTRQELDQVISDLPVLLYRVDGHSASLNTRGLRCVFGAKLEEGMQLDGSCEPTGVLSRQAYEVASRKFKRMIPSEVERTAFRQAAQYAARNGVLTLGALLGSDEPEDNKPELLQEVRTSLPVEVITYAQTRSVARVKRMSLPRIGGCILIDGSFGSHSAALRFDYADAPGNQGCLYFSDDELLKFLSDADSAGLQVAVHAIGDRAVEQVVSCYESFLAGNSLRHRIEHAELLDIGLIDRIARLGLVLCVQPSFEHFWGGKGRMYEQRLGERYQMTNPYRELLDARVILAGGSDAPITPISPTLGVRSAVNHPVPEHRLNLFEALRLFLDWSAYALGSETSKGSLVPEHDADFVVLKEDALDTLDMTPITAFRAGRELVV